MRDIGASGSGAKDVRFAADIRARADIARSHRTTFAKSHDGSLHAARDAGDVTGREAGICWGFAVQR